MGGKASLPSVGVCQIFDSQRTQQGSKVFDADGQRPQESQAVIWHRLVVSGSPRVVEELLNDLSSNLQQAASVNKQKNQRGSQKTMSELTV